MTKIPESEMTLYGISSFFGKTIIAERDDSIVNNDLQPLITISYYSVYARRSDIIMLNEGNGNKYLTYISDYYIAKYNPIKSNSLG